MKMIPTTNQHLLSAHGSRISSAILEELNRAVAKHPKWPENIVMQVAIVAEEAGEAIKAANQMYEADNKLDVLARSCELRAEIIQTAATCIRFLAHLEVDRRPVEVLKYNSETTNNL